MRSIVFMAFLRISGSFVVPRVVTVSHVIDFTFKTSSKKMDDSIARTLKDMRDVFGEILMSSEFVDNFYICFFTLSPNSELKFANVTKQKLAFSGFITSLLKMVDDPGIIVFAYVYTFTEAVDKLEWVRKKHYRMRVSEAEIKAFCSSLLVTLKCSNKLSPSQSKVLQRIEKQVDDLQKFMCSDADKKGCVCM